MTPEQVKQLTDMGFAYAVRVETTERAISKGAIIAVTRDLGSARFVCNDNNRVFSHLSPDSHSVIDLKEMLGT